MNENTGTETVLRRKYLPIWLLLPLGLIAGIFLAYLILLNSVALMEWGLSFVHSHPIYEQYAFNDTKDIDNTIQKLEKDNTNLSKKIDKFTPNEPYLVVNTVANSFALMKGKSAMREGICSTGSYTLLKGGNQQEWMFKTPQGMHKVQKKVKNPVWAKPDWAFVEEGLPIPPKGAPERFEPYVLGKYKMEIGDGYMIHGTIYKRFLGLPVTHGCVRMGDDDLEAVYSNLELGSKVFIF
jgi:hypothetical protein